LPERNGDKKQACSSTESNYKIIIKLLLYGNNISNNIKNLYIAHKNERYQRLQMNNKYDYIFKQYYIYIYIRDIFTCNNFHGI